MNVSRDDNGDIKLDSEDHNISFSWNRQVTPEDKKTESTNKLISDVVNTPKGTGGSIEPPTPRSKKQLTMGEMD